MYIIKGLYKEFASGETIKDALEDYYDQHGSYEFKDLEFYEANEIQVKVEYIVE